MAVVKLRHLSKYIDVKIEECYSTHDMQSIYPETRFLFLSINEYAFKGSDISISLLRVGSPVLFLFTYNILMSGLALNVVMNRRRMLQSWV